MEDDERNRPFLSYDAPPSDDDFSTGDRLSSDVTRDDHNWFTREQERDQLLSIPRRGGVLGRMTGRRVQDFEDNSVDTQAQTKALLDEGSRGEKRTRRRHGRDEVMHKIEEGGSRSSTPASESSEGSSEADREKIGAVLARRKVCSPALYTVHLETHPLRVSRLLRRDACLSIQYYTSSSPSYLWP